MAKPDDTQCRALIDGERCDLQISFDEAGDHWSVFCTKHRKEDDKAREAGKPRPARIAR